MDANECLDTSGVASEDIKMSLSEPTLSRARTKDSMYLAISPDDTENDDDDELGTPIGVDNDELGTPTGELGTPTGINGGDEEAYAMHRFIGPSDPCDASSAPALHGLRSISLSAKPPSFTSTVASRNSIMSQPKSRTSSVDSRSDVNTPVRRQSTENSLNSYRVTFTDALMGFTGICSENAFQVDYVERNSLAFRAGVVVGDIICSVNEQDIESDITEDQWLRLLNESSLPRTIIFMRNHPILASSKSSVVLDRRPVLSGKLTSVFSYGSSMLGSALKLKKTIIHKDVVCEGCGVDSISGTLWTCSVCSNFNLCSDCYGSGTHGMEDTEEMKILKEAIVQYQLVKRCKHFDAEFLLCLRHDICLGRPDKLEYMGNWIADIVNGVAASKITVRGIEIPRLAPPSRQRFVSKLLPLVSNRTDIDVNIEWIPDELAVENRESDEVNPVDHTTDNETNGEDKLEKLRIWISDKKSRKTSPF